MDKDLENKLDEVDFEDLLNYRMSRLFGKNIKNASLAKVVYNEVLPENSCCNDGSISPMGFMTPKAVQPTQKVKMHGGNVVCECEEEEEEEAEELELLEAEAELDECEVENEALVETPSVAQLINFATNYAAQALQFANQTLKNAPATSDCLMPQNEAAATSNNSCCNQTQQPKAQQQTTPKTQNCCNPAQPQQQKTQPMITVQNVCPTPAVEQTSLTPCQEQNMMTNHCGAATANFNEAMFNDMMQQLNRIEMMTREMYTTNRELYKSILKYCKTYIYNNLNNNDC